MKLRGTRYEGDEKNVRLFALVVAGMLSSLAIAMPLSEDFALQQRLPLYSVPPDNPGAVGRNETEQDQSFAALKNGRYGKLEDFTVRARLAFRADERQMVVEARTFTLRPPVISPASEWRNENTLYAWNGVAGQANPISLPLSPGKSKKPFQLGDFDEFWLDYTPSPGIPLCLPRMEFGVAARPYGADARTTEIVARTGTPYALKVITAIDATQAYACPTC